jgi:4-amino-4-deoxy-L-arabinose transferase-like glycosyltransferase
LKPVIVTSLEAHKLPRGLLLLLCAAYIVPGLLGRDPWSGDDAIGFGIAFNMVKGDWQQWLLPAISGLPMVAEGPAPYWFGALLAKALGFVLGIGVEQSAAYSLFFRIATGTWLAVFFVAMWYCAYSLARRPEVQPNDPLSMSASPINFGRAIADSSLLIVLATLGLVARLHEFSSSSFQIALLGVFLLACAEGLRRPMRAGLLAGFAVAASLLTKGLPVALALIAVLIALPVLVRQYRLVTASFTSVALLSAGILAGLWPLALLMGSSQAHEHLRMWWMWNLSSIGFGGQQTLFWLVRNSAWAAWPAWPVALWALLRWRGKRREPAVALPLIACGALGVATLVSPVVGETQFMLLLPALALLAALGLAGINRSLVSLMDWFAVMVFTLFGLAVWAYWGAFVGGVPVRMAASAARFAPGFKPDGFGIAVIVGVLASAAWLGVIWWRTARHPRAIWRSVALSGSGMVLAWLLLMTLWLPVFNYRKTYTDLATTLASKVPSNHQCVSTLGVSASQRALFTQAAQLKFEPVPYNILVVSSGRQHTSEANTGANCSHLLIEDRSTKPVAIPKLANGKWTQVWEGRRPADRRERFRLMKKT